MSTKNSRVIVALDFAEREPVMQLVERLNPDLCKLKVGKELFTRCGPEIVKTLVNRNFDVFLDLKFHDIPNTVARACAAAMDLGVWMLNVHALGGPAMLAAAREAVAAAGVDAPHLIAVTLLTSSGEKELAALGIQQSATEFVARLASMAADAGLDGVVCSAHEASTLKQRHGTEFLLVTPGIRLLDSVQDDQQRVMTPSRALSHGADYLVIGRPVTQAADPIQILRTINSDIS